jgi:hypothetical protein
MIVTVNAAMTANTRTIAAALSVIRDGETAHIAGQDVRRASKGKYLVGDRDAGPGLLAVKVIESLAADQEATDALLQAARAEATALQVGFAARRHALPAGDVPEADALADPGLRTLTPALLAAALDDPACLVVGVPCLVEIAASMIHARIVGAESRPDPRLAAKYGDELYPGVLMIRESNGADVWHKISRRSVMIAASLSVQYDAGRPAAARVSLADLGLARLSAQAARAAADLAAAQQKAQAAAAALMASQIAAQQTRALQAA